MKEVVEVRTTTNLVTKMETASLYVETTNLSFEEIKNFHKEKEQIEIVHDDSRVFVYKYTKNNIYMHTVVINYHNEDVNPASVDEINYMQI